MNYLERLRGCIDAADEIILLAHVLSELDIPDDSTVYAELMYFLASKCEAYLDSYYK